MSDLVNYNLKPNSIFKEATDTLSVIAEITGKSIHTMFSTI